MMTLKSIVIKVESTFDAQFDIKTWCFKNCLVQTLYLTWIEYSCTNFERPGSCILVVQFQYISYCRLVRQTKTRFCMKMKLFFHFIV